MLIMMLLSVVSVVMSLVMNFMNLMFISMILIILVIFIMGGLVEFSLMSMFVYLDVMSVMMIMLTLWFIFLMSLSEFDKDNNDKVKNLLFFSLMLFLLLFFSSSNFILLYIYFEISLLPVVFIIFFYGAQKERLVASLYLLFYTLFVSLPLLVILIYLLENNNLDMNYLNKMGLLMNLINMKLIILMMAFLVKLPIYMFHMWLPKAHVEAPLVGSMILAGVMLKMGGYGLYRVLNMVTFKNCSVLSYFFMSLGLVGGCIISMISLKQIDMKILIAYSSVSHMSFVLGGVMTFSIYGSMGGLMMMISHGLCSSLMFYLSNIFYERFMTRNLYFYSGMLLIFPSLYYLWFMVSVFNMGAPPSMNFVSELMLIMSMVKWSMYLFLLVVVIMILVAFYSIFFFSKVMHGKIWFSYSCVLLSKKEFVVIIMHMYPLLLYLLKMEIFMMWI